jgi:HEAT repeat protein
VNVNEPVSELDLDPKLTTNFLVQLNISRRNAAAYPQGHPLIAATVSKVAVLLDLLLAGRPEFTLCVARDLLLVGGNYLAKNHPVFRDLARVLFDHGIVAVTFASGLSEDELQCFNQMLNASREEIHGRGGIEAVCAEAGLRHIRVREVCYDLFHVREEEPIAGAGDHRQVMAVGGIWEQFVQALVAGTLDPSGESANSPERLDPEILAAIVNERQGVTAGGGQKSYDGAIVSFLRQLDREKLASRYGSETLDKLGALVGRLSPDLRRQFLRSSFAALEDHLEVAEDVLTKLPESVILDALEEVNSRGATVPPHIVGLLQKLARHSLPPGRTVAAEATATGEGLADKLRILFREEPDEDFVPERYQADLHTLIALDRIAVIEGEEAANLKNTLLGHSVEAQVSNVILEILPVGAPFADPLLDRLATESSMTLRRYFVDCLVQLGGAGRPAVIARLGDDRWYFVRNLVVILRRLDDRGVLRHISRFISHPHPRVRQEVLRTFLFYQDPEADRLLLKDLKSSSREQRLGAAQLSEFSRSPEVFSSLLEILERGGIADFEFELKRAVVRTLAEIGNPEALAALASVLRGKSLLHPVLHGRLKSEIITSLGRYPAATAAPLLGEIAQSDQGDLAWQAAEILRSLQKEKP